MISIISIILALAFSVTTFIIIILTGVNPLVYFVAYILISILLVFAVKIINLNFKVKIENRYALISYFVFNLYAAINFIVIKYSYGNYFGIFVDDSKYFYRALDVSRGINIGPVSIYEKIISFSIKFLELFTSNTSEMPVYLVLINIFFLSLTIGILSYIYSYYLEEKMPMKYLVLFIFLNVIVIKNSVYLYRDSIAICFFFLAFISRIQGMRIAFWLFFIATFTIRGAYGILLLFYYILSYLFEKVKINRKLIIIASFIGLGVSYIIFDYLIPYVSFWGNNTLSHYADSVLTSRTEIRADSLGGIKGVLFSSAIIRPIIFLFSPISFAQINLMQTIKQNISSWETIEFSVNYFDWLAPISWFTTVFVAITIPVILSSVIKMYKNSIKKYQVISIFFVFSWIAISLFSMQSRHFVVLILFFPIFYAYHNKVAINKSVKIYKLITLFLIIIINLI